MAAVDDAPKPNRVWTFLPQDIPAHRFAKPSSSRPPKVRKDVGFMNGLPNMHWCKINSSWSSNRPSPSRKGIMYERVGCSMLPIAPSWFTRNLIERAVFLAILLPHDVLASVGYKPCGCCGLRNLVRLLRSRTAENVAHGGEVEDDLKATFG